MQRNNILNTFPLTDADVRPSRFQLQNVYHVLKVFNEKAVAALRVQGCEDTANLIQFVLKWWNTVNVSSKGQATEQNIPTGELKPLNPPAWKHFSTSFRIQHQGTGRADSNARHITQKGHSCRLYVLCWCG
ncbi:polyphosphoinositide phosphatase [Plakobranchus ocellatus]|uniref:Polyphosphoinositide phosphatase n=1 Tax=Plakobranchus ocellatus TaxID=259542 RepID=A0AAV4C0X1_9GAST|nr:polyphosphoinositide phosphatase [Plakobranchus ocellatus]